MLEALRPSARLGENPLSRAQIESKFTYADGVLSVSAIAGTLDAVGDLENLGSVRKLMDMLPRAAPARDARRRPRLTRSAHGRRCEALRDGPHRKRDVSSRGDARSAAAIISSTVRPDQVPILHGELAARACRPSQPRH